MKNKIKVLLISLVFILSIIVVGVPTNAAIGKKVDVSGDIKELHYRFDITIEQYYEEGSIGDILFVGKMSSIEKKCDELLETKKLPRKQKKCLKEIRLNANTMQYYYKNKDGSKNYSGAKGHMAIIDETLEKYGLEKYKFEE